MLSLLKFSFKDTKMDETFKFTAFPMNLTEFKFLSAMHYNDHAINIYECAHTTPTEGRKYNSNYYFGPKCYLDHASASSQYNDVTQEHEMNFSITFWDDDLQSLVSQHLRRIFRDHDFPTDQVCIFPYDKVTLKASRNNFDGFQLPSYWIYCSFGSPKVIDFKLICDSASKAKELADKMRRQPNHQPKDFSDFYLLFGYVQSYFEKQGTVCNEDIIIQSSIVFKEGE